MCWVCIINGKLKRDGGACQVHLLLQKSIMYTFMVDFEKFDYITVVGVREIRGLIISDIREWSAVQIL